jgi:ferrochelatase
MGGDGVKSVQVLCPGFSADCLETLEEIAMENRDVFLEAGGERYEYIPCLNADRPHIDMLTGLVEKHLGGWPTDAGENPQAVAERARKLGAQQ